MKKLMGDEGWGGGGGRALFFFTDPKCLCPYTEQRIDLRMSFYVKHNRCELKADHCKKGPLSMFGFLPFLSIYSNAYILH